MKDLIFDNAKLIYIGNFFNNTSVSNKESSNVFKRSNIKARSNKVLNNCTKTFSKTQIKKSEQSFSHIVNKYTKLDPTLPRVNNILCPNTDCVTNTEDKPREVMYIRYDDANMKYIYLCSDCDTIWKTNESL